MLHLSHLNTTLQLLNLEITHAASRTEIYRWPCSTVYQMSGHQTQVHFNMTNLETTNVVVVVLATHLSRL